MNEIATAINGFWINAKGQASLFFVEGFEKEQNTRQTLNSFP
jgi:hypothetical protein